MMSEEAAMIRGLMERVEGFFSGDNLEVPESDGDIIRLCKRESESSTEDKKKYAYALVLSAKKEDVEVGINLLKESMEDCDEPHKSLLLIALGYFKIEKHRESNDAFDSCMKVQPFWSVPLDLKISLQSPKKKDYLMSHLLRVACFFSQDTLNNSLPRITKELHRQGLVSDQVLALSNHSVLDFNQAFDNVLHENIAHSLVPDFWKLASLRTRYLQNFLQLDRLGKGGFATVYLCRNRHDLREYAVKVITSKTVTDSLSDAMLREVEALSGLQHHHVVRYYQAWIEQAVKGSGQTPPGSDADYSLGYGETPPGSGADYSLGSGETPPGSNADYALDEETHEQEIEHCLYIQMEYCTRTLSNLLREEGYCVDENFAWKTMRQLLDGLSYIHKKNIIHRDLNPQNIFFDSNLDIKIGDFGLAKFLDKDEAGVTKTTSKSSDASRKLGAELYLAPEIVNGSGNIDQKVDIYGLGLVFLEIWHPFGTQSERFGVLGKVRNGIWPSEWEHKYPVLAAQLRPMLSDNPGERPTASELLTVFGFEV